MGQTALCPRPKLTWRTAQSPKLSCTLLRPLQTFQGPLQLRTSLSASYTNVYKTYSETATPARATSHKTKSIRPKNTQKVLNSAETLSDHNRPFRGHSTIGSLCQRTIQTCTTRIVRLQTLRGPQVLQPSRDNRKTPRRS